MALIYTIDSDGNIVVDGITYPFGPPTHRIVAGVRVDLTEPEIIDILSEWISEFNRIQIEIQQRENNETTPEQ